MFTERAAGVTASSPAACLDSSDGDPRDGRTRGEAPGGEEFELPELGGEALEPRVFVSTYHDTADHRLARRGVTLRHRVENGRGLWQLKLPQGKARLELEAGAGPARPRTSCSGCSSATSAGAALPIARLRTRREGVRADGAEIVHDSVAVLDISA